MNVTALSVVLGDPLAESRVMGASNAIWKACRIT